MESKYCSIQSHDMESKHPQRREQRRGQMCASVSNSMLLSSLGTDTPSNPRLEAQISARAAEAFGWASPVSSGSAAMSPAAGVVQMKRMDEPDHGTPSTSSETSIRKTLESKSSVSLDDVNVHYNSPKPAEIGALAYARGTEVFMGPGQEKYLGHELTHIVQQKQGLVRGTGSIGGMQVNTSSTLESAADHMQVSAAPEAASSVVPGGVVQGVFKDSRGKTLSEKDVEAMISMMEGSLENHAAVQEDEIAEERKIAKQYNKPVNKERVKSTSTLSRAYTRSKKTLAGRYRKMMRSKDVFSPEDILGDEIADAQRKAQKKHFNLDALSTKSSSAYLGTGTKAILDDGYQDDYNSREGYLATEGKFSLAKKKMKGVETIQDFNPEIDRAEELTLKRMGNSRTYGELDKNSKEFQDKKSEFTDASEVARKGAVSLRKAEGDVGFGDLFSLFTEINKTARPGDSDGGKLRGKGVSAGTINPVGSGQLGEDAFRTFSTIAAQINEIKKTKDRDLQKTQAIQLAAFAYQMTVSEHMFGDGNGRSCRLLSDAILQTFGLPPHTPTKEEGKIGKTMGRDKKENDATMDFEAGANAFLKGVKASDAILKKTSSPSASEAKGTVPLSISAQAGNRLAHRSPKPPSTRAADLSGQSPVSVQSTQIVPPREEKKWWQFWKK